MDAYFAPESAARFHWRTTLMLNYRFVAKLFAGLFGVSCVGNLLVLQVAPKSQPGGVFLYAIPLVIGFLVLFEWAEVRNLRKHIESVVTRDEDYPAASIWLSAVLEAIAPLAGFALIGGLIGWQTALGGPPLIGIIVIPVISILRLDYRICLMQGVVGGLGYWLMLGMALGQSNTDLLAEGAAVQIGKGVLVIGTGVLAGVIAHQNRQRLQEVIQGMDTANENEYH